MIIDKATIEIDNRTFSARVENTLAEIDGDIEISMTIDDSEFDFLMDWLRSDDYGPREQRIKTVTVNGVSFSGVKRALGYKRIPDGRLAFWFSLTYPTHAQRMHTK